MFWDLTYTIMTDITLFPIFNIKLIKVYKWHILTPTWSVIIDTIT